MTLRNTRVCQSVGWRSINLCLSSYHSHPRPPRRPRPDLSLNTSLRAYRPLDGERAAVAAERAAVKLAATERAAAAAKRAVVKLFAAERAGVDLAAAGCAAAAECAAPEHPRGRCRYGSV